jgi:hypothetical protein
MVCARSGRIFGALYDRITSVALTAAATATIVSPLELIRTRIQQAGNTKKSFIGMFSGRDGYE